MYEVKKEGDKQVKSQLVYANLKLAAFFLQLL